MIGDKKFWISIHTLVPPVRYVPKGYRGKKVTERSDQQNEVARCP